MASPDAARHVQSVPEGGPASWAYVGLGSNVGDPAANLRAAVHGLAELGPVAARSSLYETDPVGGPAGQASYLNAVVALDLPLVAPHELLRQLLVIEAALGRIRRERWGPRVIDLDLLAVGDAVVGEAAERAGGGGSLDAAGAGLVLPHPRIAERAFVLIPLCEIGSRRNEWRGAWVHPVAGVDACSLLAAHLGGARSSWPASGPGVRPTALRW